MIVISSWLLDRKAIRFNFLDQLKQVNEYTSSKITSSINVTGVIWSVLPHSSRQKAIQPYLSIHDFWTQFMRSSKKHLFNNFIRNYKANRFQTATDKKKTWTVWQITWFSIRLGKSEGFPAEFKALAILSVISLIGVAIIFLLLQLLVNAS